MKIFRSRKALSPVVATIILIAVTVAVSIAVAAWMGALTFSFMATEQIKMTNAQFYNAVTLPIVNPPYPAGTNVTVTMQNTGTTSVTVTQININNGPTNWLTTPFTISANTQVIANITYTLGGGWAYGANYEIEARTAKGNEFTYAVTAPTS
jgi:flagellin-like protein